MEMNKERERERDRKGKRAREVKPERVRNRVCEPVEDAELERG